MTARQPDSERPLNDETVLYWTDGSHYAGVSAAAVAWPTRYDDHRCYDTTNYELGYLTGGSQDAELFALAAAMGLAQTKTEEDEKIKFVKIYCDSSGLLSALSTGDHSILGPLVWTKTALRFLYEKAGCLHERGVSVELIWVKGHANSEGNIKADSVAFQTIQDQIRKRSGTHSGITPRPETQLMTVENVPEMWEQLGQDWVHEWLYRANHEIMVQQAIYGSQIAKSLPVSWKNAQKITASVKKHLRATRHLPRRSHRRFLSIEDLFSQEERTAPSWRAVLEHHIAEARNTIRECRLGLGEETLGVLEQGDTLSAQALKSWQPIDQEKFVLMIEELARLDRTRGHPAPKLESEQAESAQDEMISIPDDPDHASPLGQDEGELHESDDSDESSSPPMRTLDKNASLDKQVDELRQDIELWQQEIQTVRHRISLHSSSIAISTRLYRKLDVLLSKQARFKRLLESKMNEQSLLDHPNSDDQRVEAPEADVNEDKDQEITLGEWVGDLLLAILEGRTEQFESVAKPFETTESSGNLEQETMSMQQTNYLILSPSTCVALSLPSVLNYPAQQPERSEADAENPAIDQHAIEATESTNQSFKLTDTGEIATENSEDVSDSTTIADLTAKIKTHDNWINSLRPKLYERQEALSKALRAYNASPSAKRRDILEKTQALFSLDTERLEEWTRSRDTLKVALASCTKVDPTTLLHNLDPHSNTTIHDRYSDVSTAPSSRQSNRKPPPRLTRSELKAKITTLTNSIAAAEKTLAKVRGSNRFLRSIRPAQLHDLEEKQRVAKAALEGLIRERD